MPFHNSQMELVVATKNTKKLKEIKEILCGMDIKITSLAGYIKAPRIIENGNTFRDNAIKKAVKIARFTKKLTLGEDSGLCVDALGGRPGIYSSRFSGKNKSDMQNNLKLIKLLKNIPLSKRKAHYVCAVALADKKGLVTATEGRCNGIIGFKMQGHYGFGYDPLFIPTPQNRGLQAADGGGSGFRPIGNPGLQSGRGFIIPDYKKTFAELGSRIKHKMSHRYRALMKAKKIIQKYIEQHRKNCYN